MSDKMNEEIKSIGDGIDKIGSLIDARMTPLEGSVKTLTDAVAELQMSGQKAALGAPCTQVSEGTKSMIQHMRTGQAPEVQYDMNGVKAATVNNPASGGYFAVPEFQNRVLQRMYDDSPMRQICEVINVTGNLSVVPYEAQPPKGKWVGETEKRSKSSDIRIGVAQIPVNEYTVKVSVSNTLLEDANLVGIEDYIIRSASDAIGRDVNDAFVMGDGDKKPEGLYASKKLKTIQSGKSGGVTMDMIFDAMSALPNDALQNARWTMNMATFLAIAKEFGTSSSYISMPLSESIQPRIFGYPVTIVKAPGCDEDGNICATFGDHQHAYKIVQRIGLQYQRDPYTGADDNLVVTRFRTRVGGMLVMPESIVGIKVGA